MATTNENRLRNLHTEVKAGHPVISKDLAALGISADLAVYYVRAGWLRRLGRGVFVRPNEPLDLYASLRVMEHRIPGLHVGGKTALDWYGVRHYVEQHPVLQLYGWNAAKIPTWFVTPFPCMYQRKRLFQEQATKPIEVCSFEDRSDAPKVSEPERALLEVLSEVGISRTVEEAKELMESAFSLRSEKLIHLLQVCTNVKTVRLCLQLAKELSLPYLTELIKAELPMGSNKPWVSKSKYGVLVLPA